MRKRWYGNHHAGGAIAKYLRRGLSGSTSRGPGYSLGGPAHLVFRIEGLWLQGFQQLRTLAGLG